MTTPQDTPEPVAITVPANQLAIQLTPDGQHLAITFTALLPADGAKQYAAAVTQAAASMSASGLVVAGGTVTR